MPISERQNGRAGGHAEARGNRHGGRNGTPEGVSRTGAAARPSPSRGPAQDQDAAYINAEHRAGQEAGRKSLEHYLNAGKRLLAKKRALGHGEWLPWQKKNLTLSQPMASRYMRFAGRAGKLKPGFSLEQLEEIWAGTRHAPTPSPRPPGNPPSHPPAPGPEKPPGGGESPPVPNPPAPGPSPKPAPDAGRPTPEPPPMPKHRDFGPFRLDIEKGDEVEEQLCDLRRLDYSDSENGAPSLDAMIFAEAVGHLWEVRCAKAGGEVC